MISFETSLKSALGQGPKYKFVLRVLPTSSARPQMDTAMVRKPLNLLKNDSLAVLRCPYAHGKTLSTFSTPPENSDFVRDILQKHAVAESRIRSCVKSAHDKLSPSSKWLQSRFKNRYIRPKMTLRLFSGAPIRQETLEYWLHSARHEHLHRRQQW